MTDTPLMRAAADAVRRLHDHPNCGVGGNLHIVTDDWNVEDESLAFCLYCIEHGGQMPPRDDSAEYHRHYNDRKRADPDPPDQLAVERACHDALAVLSEDERYAALALEAGYWEVSGQETPQP